MGKRQEETLYKADIYTENKHMEKSLVQHHQPQEEGKLRL